MLGVWVTRHAFEESILNISLNSSSFPVCETKSGKFWFLLHTYPITGMLGWFLYSVGSKITMICIRKSQRFAFENHNDLHLPVYSTFYLLSKAFPEYQGIFQEYILSGFSRISGNLEQKNVLETIEHLIQFNKRNCYNKRKFFWSTLSLNKSQQREILHIVKIYIK